MSTTTTQPTMTEAHMLSGIKSAAKGLGFHVYHNTYALGSDRGFPDLVIVGHGVTWFLELKGPKPRIYDEQIAWIDALTDAGHDARFVYPEDYDTILAELEIRYRQRLERAS